MELDFRVLAATSIYSQQLYKCTVDCNLVNETDTVNNWLFWFSFAYLYNENFAIFFFYATRKIYLLFKHRTVEIPSLLALTRPQLSQ